MYDSPLSECPTHERCFLRDTQDALLVLQAVLNDQLPLTQRRPTEQNRSKLIKSGNVFVVDTAKGPINRWTDGLSWSPSRILGAFLLYREKKLSKTNSRRSGPVGKNVKADLSPTSKRHSRKMSVSSSSSYDAISQGMALSPGYSNYVFENDNRGFRSSYPSQLVSPNIRDHADHKLYGSLTSNEQYKEDGLLKKTITIGFHDSLFRIVGYYLPKDVEENRLLSPSQDETFANVQVDPELSDTKNIKMPVEIGDRGSELLDPIYGTPLTSTTLPPYYARLMGHDPTLSSAATNFRANKHGGDQRESMYNLELPEFDKHQLDSYNGAITDAYSGSRSTFVEVPYGVKGDGAVKPRSASLSIPIQHNLSQQPVRKLASSSIPSSVNQQQSFQIPRDAWRRSGTAAMGADHGYQQSVAAASSYPEIKFQQSRVSHSSSEGYEQQYQQTDDMSFKVSSDPSKHNYHDYISPLNPDAADTKNNFGMFRSIGLKDSPPGLLEMEHAGGFPASAIAQGSDNYDHAFPSVSRDNELLTDIPAEFSQDLFSCNDPADPDSTQRAATQQQQQHLYAPTTLTGLYNDNRY